MSASRRTNALFVRPTLLSAALIAAGLATPALHAAPQGGVVRGGNATVRSDGAETRIHQSSERAIIDWRSFDVGSAESVRFEQPSSRSATLNRVAGSRASHIDGRVVANGQVFVVNRAGVIFGNNAQINVGALIATTANLDNADFLAGRLNFSEAGQRGAEIRNRGQLTAADGGLIALVAPRVSNDGVITARLGRVALASGETFTLDLEGDQLIRFTLPAEQALALENAGTVLADGGEIVLIGASAARQVVDSVVNLDGVVRADTIEQRDGKIILGGPDSRLTVSGEISARGLEDGAHGGHVDLRGRQISLDDARIHVSGTAGGGQLHVGGEWQGSGDGARAQSLSVDETSRLAADATREGDGGEVVLWSDGDTRFAGEVSARGGLEGGDGGRVEVSGKGSLEFRGEVDAGATAGDGGQLLLDPLDLTVGAPEAGSISRILRSGTTTTLQADRDIAVDSAIDGRGGSAGGGLVVDAGRNITVNDFIVTNDGAVSLTARSGTIDMAADKAIFSGSAPISATAGDRLSAGVLLTGGQVALRSTGAAVHVDGVVDPGNGRLEIDAATDIELNAAVLNLQSGADVALTAGGDVHVNQQINGLGAASAGGRVSIAADGKVVINDFVVTSDGAVDIRAGSGGLRFAEGAAILAGTAPIELAAGGDLTAGATVSSATVTLTSSGGAVTIAAPVEADNGDLDISAATDIVVDAPVVNLVSGSKVELRAGQDIAVNAQINGVGASIVGGSVLLDAGRDVRIGDHIATTDGAVSVAAGGAINQLPEALISTGSAAIELVSGASLTSGALLTSGTTTLRSTAGDLTIGGLVPESSGDLTIDASGTVRIDQPIANLRSGATLGVDAGTDLIVAAQIDGLGATEAGAVRLNAARDVQLDAFVATTLAPIDIAAGGRLSIGPGGGVFAEAAPIALSAGGDLLVSGPVSSPQTMTLDSSGGSVELSSGFAPGGALEVSAALDLRVSAPITSLALGQPLSLSAGRDVFVTGQIDGRGGFAGGSVSIDAGRALSLSSAIVTDNGAITLTSSGDVDYSASSGLFAGSAPITVRAGGALRAGPSLSSGAITISSSGGSLSTSGAISGGSVSLTAPLDVSIAQPVSASATLSASAGRNMGVSASVQGRSISLGAGQILDVNAPAIASDSLSVGGSTVNAGGGLFSGGALGISSVSDLNVGGLSAGDSVSVFSSGTLTVSDGVGGLPGSVSFAAGGDLNLAAPIANLGGSATLSAGGTVRVDNQIDNISGGISINAGQDALINNHVVANNSAINVSAGGTIAHLANGLDAFGAPQSMQLRAGTGNITETAGATVSIGSMITSGSVSVTSTGGDINVDIPIYETTGDTTLTAAGDININQVIANATTGADLVLSAGGDINVGAKVGPWDRVDATYPVAGRNALAGGSISMTATGDINIGAEIATFKDVLTGNVAELTLTSTAGSVDFTAADLRVMSDSGDVTISSFANFVNGPPMASINDAPTTGYYTTGHLSLNSTGGNVTIERLIPDSTGSVSIGAANGVRINNRIYTDSGDITIIAGAGGITQDPTADPDGNPATTTGVVSDIDARLGNIRLEAVGDIRPSLLRTGAKLTIKSTGGSIIGGSVDLSRDLSTAPPTTYGLPSEVELAGFNGISGFNAKGTPVLSAISAGGSISNLSFAFPSSLLLIAAQDIVSPSSLLGSAPRLYAGRDIQLSAITAAGNVVAKAGRDLVIASSASPLHGGSADLSAGSDPFASIAGTTVAGVAVPAWSGPFGASFGNVTVGAAGDIAWIEGTGGLVINATGNVFVPKVHVSYDLNTAANTTNVLQTTQPLTVAAGNNVQVEQIETTGPVSITSTGGDITLGATIGAHVAVMAPADFLWNPNDLGVASVVLQADAGNINMHEARAVGNITIAAPLGQVTFAGPNGIEAGGSRSVTDSDGVVFGNTIDAAPVARLPAPSIVSPAISPGPTLAGPGAPPQPGALPPAGPAGVTLTAASASPGSVAIGTPGGASVSVAGPGGIAAAGGSGPASADVGSSVAPAGDGGFGEIFVAQADQGVTEVRDPVRVETRREGDEQAAGERSEADQPRDIDGSEDAHEAQASAEDGRDEAGQSTEDAGDAEESIAVASAQNAAADEDEDEDERRAADGDEQTTVVVFAGGRGDARERDFGHGLPFEDGRVRP